MPAVFRVEAPSYYNAGRAIREKHPGCEVYVPVDYIGPDPNGGKDRWPKLQEAPSAEESN